MPSQLFNEAFELNESPKAPVVDVKTYLTDELSKLSALSLIESNGSNVITEWKHYIRKVLNSTKRNNPNLEETLIYQHWIRYVSWQDLFLKLEFLLRKRPAIATKKNQKSKFIKFFESDLRILWYLLDKDHEPGDHRFACLSYPSEIKDFRVIEEGEVLFVKEKEGTGSQKWSSLLRDSPQEDRFFSLLQPSALLQFNEMTTLMSWRNSSTEGQNLPSLGYIFHIGLPPMGVCKCRQRCDDIDGLTHPLDLSLLNVIQHPTCCFGHAQYANLYFEFSHFLVKLIHLRDFFDLVTIICKAISMRHLIDKTMNCQKYFLFANLKNDNEDFQLIIGRFPDPAPDGNLIDSEMIPIQYLDKDLNILSAFTSNQRDPEFLYKLELKDFFVSQLITKICEKFLRVCAEEPCRFMKMAKLEKSDLLRYSNEITTICTNFFAVNLKETEKLVEQLRSELLVCLFENFLQNEDSRKELELWFKTEKLFEACWIERKLEFEINGLPEDEEEKEKNDGGKREENEQGKCCCSIQ